MDYLETVNFNPSGFSIFNKVDKLGFTKTVKKDKAVIGITEKIKDSIVSGT